MRKILQLLVASLLIVAFTPTAEATDQCTSAAGTTACIIDSSDSYADCYEWGNYTDCYQYYSRDRGVSVDNEAGHVEVTDSFEHWTSESSYSDDCRRSSGSYEDESDGVRYSAHAYGQGGADGFIGSSDYTRSYSSKDSCNNSSDSYNSTGSTTGTYGYYWVGDEWGHVQAGQYHYEDEWNDQYAWCSDTTYAGIGHHGSDPIGTLHTYNYRDTPCEE